MAQARPEGTGRVRSWRVFFPLLGLLAALVFPAPAQACCQSGTCTATAIAQGSYLVTVGDTLASWVDNLFSNLYQSIYYNQTAQTQTITQDSTQAAAANRTALTDVETTAVFNSGMAVATSATALKYNASRTACLAELRSTTTHQAKGRYQVQRAASAQASNDYLGGTSALTQRGPVATTAGQFQRTASSFFRPGAWRCPAGLTCNALPSSTAGTLAGGSVDAARTVFNLHTIERGSNEEIAANLWADLASVPVPEARVDGDQLALPAARWQLRQTRSDILEAHLLRDVVVGAVDRRLARTPANEPSHVGAMYTAMADHAALYEMAMALGQEDARGAARTIGEEVDKLNYAYWQMYEHLEKIALMKAAELKSLLEERAAQVNPAGAVLPAVQKL